MDKEIVQLKQYLLGNLEQTEAERLGLQIISDADTEEKLLLAEHELIEDYLEDSFSAEEKELFYKNFLVCRERENLLQEISLLKNYAKQEIKKVNLETETEKTPDNFFQSLKNWFSLNLRPAAAVLAVLVVGLLAFRIWRGFYSDSMSPLEKDYAALNQKDLSDTTEYQNYSLIALSPGTFRDDGAGAKSSAEKLTERVFFRLALPSDVGGETIYKVELLKDGKAVFTQNEIRAYQNQSGREVRLILPKSVLTKGQYQIRLENQANKESSLTYNFTVE